METLKYLKSELKKIATRIKKKTNAILEELILRKWTCCQQQSTLKLPSKFQWLFHWTWKKAKKQNKTKRSHMKTHKIPGSQIKWEQKEQF